MQAKKAVMMAVLHAVPATLLDAAPLVRQPPLLKGFHEALKALPDSPERLSGLALSVRLCISKNPGEPFALLAPLTVALPYCDEARRHGLFDLLHTTLEHVLEVHCDFIHCCTYTCYLETCRMCVLVYTCDARLVKPHMQQMCQFSVDHVPTCRQYGCMLLQSKYAHIAEQLSS